MVQIESRDPARVRGMFGRVARRYDLLNRVLSANLDRSWRRAAACRVPSGADTVLDLCGGTGDLSLAVLRESGARRVVCCDFSSDMLERARGKFLARRVETSCPLIEADALRLPFAAGSFDAVTIGFGVRNLAEMDRGFREVFRVLRPGGRLVILEFSRPTGPVLSRLYRFYLRGVLPRIGNRVSDSDGAYGYLARTIADFPEPGEIADRLLQAGFSSPGWTPLTGGIVTVHEGIKKT